MTALRVVRVYHGGRAAAHRLRERALVDAGCAVTLVVPNAWPERGSDHRIHETAFDVVELPVRRPGDVNRHVYADPAALASVITSARPDLVDIHEEPFSAVLRQVCTLVPRGIPVVAYTAQNVDKRFPPPFAQWERRAFHRLAGIYPCSRQAASVVAGKGFRNVIDVLALGIDDADAPGDQRAEPPFLMALVGRLVPEKGVSDAIEAVSGVRAGGVDARLLLIGAGPSEPAARRLVRERGLDHAVDFQPWLDPVELGAIYRRCHLLLVPSRATATWVEQFGRTIVEAQAAGAVVVGYASGAIPEVAGAAAVLVEEGNVAALTRAVALLARDPQRWALLRQLGLASADERRWSSVAAQQTRFYRTTIASGPPLAPHRDDRAAAQERWGPPARSAAGPRPFALPLLRRDTVASRVLARAIDGLPHR